MFCASAPSSLAAASEPEQKGSPSIATSACTPPAAPPSSFSTSPAGGLPDSYILGSCKLQGQGNHSVTAVLLAEDILQQGGEVAASQRRLAWWALELVGLYCDGLSVTGGVTLSLQTGAFLCRCWRSTLKRFKQPDTMPHCSHATMHHTQTRSPGSAADSAAALGHARQHRHKQVLHSQPWLHVLMTLSITPTHTGRRRRQKRPLQRRPHLSALPWELGCPKPLNPTHLHRQKEAASASSAEAPAMSSASMKVRTPAGPKGTSSWLWQLKCTSAPARAGGGAQTAEVGRDRRRQLAVGWKEAKTQRRDRGHQGRGTSTSQHAPDAGSALCS
jgi:hypothetical protein